MLLLLLLLLLLSSLLPAESVRCSSLLPDHQSFRSKDETQMEVRLEANNALCLVRSDGGVVVVSVVRTEVHHQVSQLYSYTWPQVQVSCYCTCTPSQCQLPHCRLCYNITRLSTPCSSTSSSSSSSSSSSTCCSVRLSAPHPVLTGLRLGQSSLQVHYRLQTISPAGKIVETLVERVHVGGGGGSTVQHKLQGGELVLQVSALSPPSPHLQGWMVVRPDGSLRPGDINPPHLTDSRLAGWLKVEDGSVLAPSRQVISGGLHITTEDCRKQTFSADLSGLNLSPGTLPSPSLPHLTWDGNRTVTEAGKHRVRLRLLLRAPGGVRVFGNQTRLGPWAASLLLSRSEVRLNITTHHSQGLILGRIQNVSFSFFVSSPAQSSASVSTVIPMLVPGLTSPRLTVCLRVLSSHQTCQHVAVVRRQSGPELQHKYSPSSSEVQPIPVMWHLDSQPVTR